MEKGYLDIRKVLINEVELLQQISKQTFMETYSSGNTEENMMRYLEEEFSIDKLASELKDQYATFYFARYDSKIVGYLKVNFGDSQTELHDKNTLEIQRIYVSKKFQGSGIGKSLYEKAIKIAQEKEVDFVWLGVWEENPKAIRFYEKVGFEAFDKHIFVLGDEEQTDIMMKKVV
ncbi:GNAT family N-acetyltransferase [Marivirga sp.]|uniref:GNAT family N-acetyltransferase n=1 Tax=Marivirga sp. TaxID=2018662 RepID=UPI003DA71235